MAEYRLFPSAELFGRNRREPEIWWGYFDANGGSITPATKLSIAQTHYIGSNVASQRNITLDAANDEIDLAVGGLYEVEAFVDQTGAAGIIDIYNVTGTAVLMSSPAEEGVKRVKTLVYAAAAMSIGFRAAAQTANSATATTSQITVKYLGDIQT